VPEADQIEVLSKVYAGKRVLVTGGASFIGSHLTELLLAAGATVAVADDLSSGTLGNLDQSIQSVEFIECDLREADAANRAIKDRDVVFHLAAAHGGRGYIDSHPVECLNNMALDHTLFSAAAHANVAKIVSASSACVYPTSLQEMAADRALLTEEQANFETPGAAFADGEYGWAKLMSELQLRAFHRQYGMAGVACRIFTAYGERENETHAVVALIAKAVARADPYPIWGNGLQTRNFTHVSDTVMGMALAGARLDGFDVINIGTPQHHTIMELIEEIFHSLEWRPAEIVRQLDKPVGVASRAADITKCRELLEWEPSTSLHEGVARTVTWYVEEYGTSRLGQLESLLVER
jgi:UDP-glucose 4-epimerase